MRFYDLARDPIVCPACGAVYVVVAPIVARDARPASSTTRGGWRNRTVMQPTMEEPVPAPDGEAEAPTESGVPEADDEIVLEEDTDEGEVTELIDRTGPAQS